MSQLKEVPGVDPITFKIIQHRLSRVTDEAVTALKRVSGSQTTNEGHDLMVALYTADGDLMEGGVGFLHHYVGGSRAVKHLLDRFEGDINPGDVFMLNDAYTAALHAPDVYIVKPIFYEGELRAFSANFVHVRDIGAADPGGFSPTSQSVYQEGFQTPGLKIIEEGEKRQDVLDTILNMSRSPEQVELDIRSQIAANNVASDRITELLEEYGPAVVRQVSERLIELSEEGFLERLSELPDGRWRSRQYMESVVEDKMFTLDLTLIKEGDSLTFDFSGTSEQSEYGLNATKWAALGGVLAPMLPLLCHDLTWNDGIIRNVELSAPEGSIVNATSPAPVSIATVATIKRCNAMSSQVVSKMLGSHDEYADRATGMWNGAFAPYKLSVTKDGKTEIGGITDSLAGSGGGRAFDDGIDLGGELANIVSRWANVERTERDVPIMYLFRNFLTDSGGPGENRGGLASEYAIVPMDEDAEVSIVSFMHGTAVPESAGIFGGYPGCTITADLLRSADVWDEKTSLPESRDEIESKSVENFQWGLFEMDATDVIHVTTAGSGGYGDPLTRDSERVLSDLETGAVSPESARNVYGVPVDDAGKLTEDIDAYREECVEDRLNGSPAEDRPDVGETVSADNYRLGPALDAVEPVDGEGTYFACEDCGAVIGDATGNWKQGAIREEVPIETAGRNRESDDQFVLRRFFCPECGALLDTEVTHKDDAPLVDRFH